MPGEPPVDDTDVDDWLLRFFVLRGSSICFYLRATGLILSHLGLGTTTWNLLLMCQLYLVGGRSVLHCSS